ENLPALEPAATPVLDGGGLNLRNLAYAGEWFIFGGFAVAIWWRMIRDESRELAAREEVSAGTAGGEKYEPSRTHPRGAGRQRHLGLQALPRDGVHHRGVPAAPHLGDAAQVRVPRGGGRRSGPRESGAGQLDRHRPRVDLRRLPRHRLRHVESP